MPLLGRYGRDPSVEDRLIALGSTVPSPASVWSGRPRDGSAAFGVLGQPAPEVAPGAFVLTLDMAFIHLALWMGRGGSSRRRGRTRRHPLALPLRPLGSPHRETARLADDCESIAEEVRFFWDGTTLCEQTVHTQGQPHKLLALDEDLGGKGVRYMVSNEWSCRACERSAVQGPPRGLRQRAAEGVSRAWQRMSGMSSWLK